MIAVLDAWINTAGLIIVALISGGVALRVRRLDAHNTDQHGQNLSVLSMLNEKVDGVSGDVKSLAETVGHVAEDVTQVRSLQTDHLEWHLDQEAHKVIDLTIKRDRDVS